jgi:hypothetical protein
MFLRGFFSESQTGMTSSLERRNMNGRSKLFVRIDIYETAGNRCRREPAGTCNEAEPEQGHRPTPTA